MLSPMNATDVSERKFFASPNCSNIEGQQQVSMDMGSDFLCIEEDSSAVADLESKRESFMELFFFFLYDLKVER